MAKSPIIAEEPGFEAPSASTAKTAPPVIPQGQLRGWRIAHPGFGSMVVWADGEIQNESAAVEHYRQSLCPTIKLPLLQESGLAVHPRYFTPAATEIGKPPNPVKR